jgi:hypothetical protein
MPDPTTQELKIAQIKRERDERVHADEADTEPGERTAIRRADKAAYLREKLEDQQAADDAAGV